MSHYKPYPAYKDSGVERLGRVPAHWDEKRLRHVVRPINEKLEATGSDFPYLGLENIESWTGKLLPTESKVEGLSNTFRPRDVLFGKLRPYLAKVHAAEQEGICTSEALVLRTEQIEPNYLKYWMLTPDFINAVDSSTYGAKMPRANWEFIGNLRVPLPAHSEQETIATFLDRDTARIDAMIEKKQRLIELLKEKRQALITQAVTKGLDPNVPMKDSGVEWLGDVPAHWKTSRLKFLGEAIIGLTYDPSEVVDDGEGHLVLRASNVRDSEINFDDNVYVKKLVPPRLITRPGDVVICSRSGSRELIGKNALITKQSAGSTFGAFMTVFRCKLNAFLYYTLNSSLFAYQSGSFMTSTINQLTVSTLNNFAVPLPPAFEREKIVGHLNRTLFTLTRLSERTARSISLLQERRSALITAAVTGQIDVRDAA